MSLEGKDILNAAKRQPVAATCAVIFAVLGLFLYFRMDSLSEAESHLEERTRLRSKLKSNVTYSVQLDAHLKALAEANKTIKASALRVDELARNQQLFYRLESETGVRMIDLRQSTATVPTGKAAVVTTYTPVNFSLTVEGEYKQVLLFIRRLERGGAFEGGADGEIGPISRISNTVLSIGANKVPAASITVEMLGLRQ